jgi:hypothetical protein
MNRIGQKIEGRIGLQTRLLDGGRYLGIPRNGGFQHSLSIQGTRSGTRLLGGLNSEGSSIVRFWASTSQVRCEPGSKKGRRRACEEP